MKKGMPFRVTGILAVLVLGAAGQSVLATEIHTWKDKDGVVHFSDTMPANTATQTIEIDDAQQSSASAAPAPKPAGTGDQPQSAAQQRRQEIADARAAQREEREKTEAVCQRHRQRLEQMEPARRVYYRDENGQEVRMDDVQRITLVEESRNFLAENCN